MPSPRNTSALPKTTVAEMKRPIPNVLGSKHKIVAIIMILSWHRSDSMSAFSDSTTQTCHEAQLQCYALNGCRQALSNFYTQCSRLLLGKDKMTTCPTSCKHAMVSLFSAENNAGVAFVNCNCDSGQLCLEQKQRVEVCEKEVMSSLHLLHQETPVSCNLARWICEAETMCLTALRYYYDRCGRLFKGSTRCHSKCKNSLRILSRQSRANKLRTCVCDGSEDFDCRRWKMSTEKLCFKSRLSFSDNTTARRRRRRRRKNRTESKWRVTSKRHGRKGRRKRKKGRHRKNRHKRMRKS